MHETKIAIVLRDDLQPWQALNVTAFLTGGLVARSAELIGEPYRDGVGNVYNPLIRQPVIVLSASGETMARIHQRCLTRKVRASAYVEEMFETGHDAANRDVFSRYAPEEAKLVGLAIHEDRKTVDKITKGARMHP
ncbi:MAG: DUF2000 family protein [Pseudomonadota bacterium]